MILKRTVPETIEELKTAQHHIRMMDNYMKKGLYKSCNLKLFRQHFRSLKICMGDLVTSGCDEGREQLSFLGDKK